MSKRSYDQGVLTPETPEDHFKNGDQVLAEFTQLNLQPNQRKRQRIEIADTDSSDDEDDHFNKPAISGIIEKVELSNFMCHDHFEVELGPQINFIIGQNGSGKSAILTAISVGLGAKANDTNRGSSLKLLIKNGRSSARISITFKNEGHGSYKPDVYGKKIIVQRILKTEGGNKYSIKSGINKHITDKKLDLDSILTAFGITVNNPMLILTQDAAKSFIAVSSDEEKYKFFMAGTKADETIKNYHKTQEELKAVRERMVQLNADVRELKKTDSEAKILFDRFESQDELVRMKTLYQGKYLWVQVLDKENRVLKSQQGIRNMLEEIDSANSHIQENENSNIKLENEKHLLTVKAINFVRERDAAESELSKLKDSIKEIDSKLKDAQADVSSTQRDIDADTNKIPRLQKEISDEQERIDLINGGSHEQLHIERQMLMDELEKLKKVVNDLVRERLHIGDQFSERKQHLLQEVATEKTTKQNIERQLQMLRGSEDRRLDAFGKQVYRILDEIERDSGYHRKPLGPLGRFVNLKQGQEKWSNLLESNLSKSLSAFIVQDQHDFRRLSQLFRKYNYRASIVTKRYEIFDFSQRSANSQFQRITDVLSIEDRFIECLLVDLNNINRIILESDRQRAEQILRSSSSNNINSVLVPYDPRTGNQLKMNKFGGLQIDVIHYRNDYEKIGSQGSSEEKIARTQQNLAKITRSIQTLESQVRNLQDAKSSKELDVQRKSNETKRLISHNERSINDINNKLEETVNTGKLEALNEQISRIERENQIREQLKEDCLSKVQEIHGKLQLKTEIYKNKLGEVRRLREEDSSFNTTMAKLQAKIDTHIKEIRHYQNSIEKRERYIADLEKYIQEENLVLEELQKKAESCCSRSDADLKDGDTMESIESDKNKIEQELNEFEKHIGMTREEVTIRFQKARDAYKSAQEQIINVAKLRDDLHRSLDDRMMSFEQMRIDICNKVNDSFHKALMLRQFTGKIIFDHERGKLTMMVSTKKNEKLRNIESFSGGEKSFSQISLLLAIWDFMNTKIRGLDEFDVFMDQVNRTLSLRLILEKIKNSPSQTIFITPLDIAGIEGAEGRNVHIHRIADPKKS